MKGKVIRSPDTYQMVREDCQLLTTLCLLAVILLWGAQVVLEEDTGTV